MVTAVKNNSSDCYTRTNTKLGITGELQKYLKMAEILGERFSCIIFNVILIHRIITKIYLIISFLPSSEND